MVVLCCQLECSKFFPSLGKQQFVFISVPLAQLHNVSNALTLQFCADWCHAIHLYLSLATNNFFSNSLGLSCISSAKIHKIFIVYTWFLQLPIGRKFFPQFGLAAKRMCLIVPSFERHYNASKARNFKFCAVGCYAMYLYLFLARYKFFFNSFGLSCISSVQTHSFLMFLYGCSLLPFGKQDIRPQFGLKTIHLLLFPIP